MISASLSLHKSPEDVAKAVIEMGYRPVPSSLHVNESSVELIKTLAVAGNRSMTFAVEHGDREFQKRLGKDVDPAHLNELLHVGVENGLKNLKLYFIMGLGEDPEFNAQAGVSFLKTALDGITGLNVTVSFSVIVPKPWTPFENLNFPSRSFVKKEIRMWKRLVRENGLMVDLLLPSYKEAFEEFAVSRFYGNLAERYVLKKERLETLLEEAQDREIWKNVRHIDPRQFIEWEWSGYMEGRYPVGCKGDCATCMVKSIGKEGI